MSTLHISDALPNIPIYTNPKPLSDFFLNILTK